MAVRLVDVHSLAVRELQRTHGWYARRSPSAAQRFQQAMQAVVQRIAAAAEQGSPYRHRYRWPRLKGFPFLVYYEIRDPQPVLIYAVAHARRRPGYWLRRTRP